MSFPIYVRGGRVMRRKWVGPEGLRTDSRSQAGVRGRARSEPGYARPYIVELLLEDAGEFELENGIPLLLEELVT